MQVDTKSSPRRGRPRAYDPGTVLTQVLNLFWRRGYAATSLDDLVQATGVNRPSLYAGFGDKETIYLRALEHFRDRVEVRLAAALVFKDAADTAARAIDRYFAEVIDIYCGEKGDALGCAVFCTAVSDAPHRKKIRNALLEALNGADVFLTGFLRQASRDGRFSGGKDPVAVARLLCAVQHSLALRARAGQTRAELQELAAAVSLVVAHERVPPARAAPVTATARKRRRRAAKTG